ncbi:MAG TPA: CGNR zinc finger domain-containing protein [Jiangellaceae bacterium]|nr:CGNR zinc finger domain-containing protein [Jiangellaceae bacterium]
MATARTRAPASVAGTGEVSASFAAVLPGEPVTVRFMNTLWADRHGVHDAISTTSDLRAWLSAIQLDDESDSNEEPAPNNDDLERFRTLRDALRRLAALVTGDTRPAAASPITDIDQAVAAVNDAAVQAATWPQLHYKDGALQRVSAGSATPARRALSSIASHSIATFTGEDRVQLRACFAPGCVLYFVKDHPRREWCSTACGNRVRAARHYQRHRKNQRRD